MISLLLITAGDFWRLQLINEYFNVGWSNWACINPFTLISDAVISMIFILWPSLFIWTGFMKEIRKVSEHFSFLNNVWFLFLLLLLVFLFCLFVCGKGRRRGGGLEGERGREIDVIQLNRVWRSHSKVKLIRTNKSPKRYSCESEREDEEGRSREGWSGGSSGDFID